MSSVEVGIFANRNLRGKRSHNPTIYLPTDSESRPLVPTRALVYGGEGTLRMVLDFLYGRNLHTPLGLMGGGTQNGIRNELIREGFVMSEDDFTSSDYTDRRFCRLRPSYFGSMLFAYDFGLGSYEQHVGRILARTINWPGFLSPVRINMSRLKAFFSGMDENERILDIYSATPRVGNELLFPDQRIDSSSLTHAWIEGTPNQQLAKLALTLGLWRFRRRVPQGILKASSSDFFYIENTPKDVWIDGDTIPNANFGNQGEICVSRVGKQDSVPITAIV